jgi:tetratricopeptide (TPR) repeat protein
MPSRLVATLVLFLVCRGMAHGEDRFAEAWRAIAGQRYGEARETFAAGVEAPGAQGREARLGLAVALLGSQPKTQGNVSRARETLEPLATAEPVDEWVLQARYFLGRIAELHEREPDLRLARRYYRQLFEQNPSAPIAQAAAVKYALLALNAVEDADAKRATLAQLETLGDLLSHAPARRDYHVAMAYGYLRHAPEEREAARRHALAGDEAGYSDAERRRSNLLRIAELSRALGDTPMARDYYARFLAEAERDARALLVRERLDQLDGPKP